MRYNPGASVSGTSQVIFASLAATPTRVHVNLHFRDIKWMLINFSTTCNPTFYSHCLPISICVDYFPNMVIACSIASMGFHLSLYGEEGATQHWVIPGVGWHKSVQGSNLNIQRSGGYIVILITLQTLFAQQEPLNLAAGGSLQIGTQPVQCQMNESLLVVMSFLIHNNSLHSPVEHQRSQKGLVATVLLIDLVVALPYLHRL